MAALSFAAAVRALTDGDRAPTWYLTGSEDVLKQELIEALLAGALDPSVRDFNLDVRQAGDLDGESLNALIETPPMLAERRVVVVKGLEQWRRNAKVWDVLHRYLERPNPTTLLVLVDGGDKPDAKVTKAVERHVDLTSPTPKERVAWVTRRAKALGVTVEPDAAQHLLVAVGDDLGHAAKELEKLAAGSEGPVTLARVQELVGIRRGETVHDWVDAVLARDTGRAAGLVDVVLAQSGMTGVRMVMVLGTALVGTRLARGLAEKGAGGRALEKKLFDAIRAARPMGLRQWGAEAATWARSAERWTAAELDRALGDAYVADGLLKSTTVTDERGIVLSLTLALAPVEAAA